MFGVFQNIDPPPPHRHEGGHTRWVERGVGGSIVWKTPMPYTALYSIICKYFVGSSTMFVRDCTILGIF
jgi:hypothetical protein